VYLRFLLPEIAQIPQVREALSAREPCLLAGVEGAVKHLIMGALYEGAPASCVVVAADNARADRVYTDLAALFPKETELFPGENLLFFSEILSRSYEISEARLSLLYKLAGGEKKLVVAPLQALLPRLLPKDLWQGRALRLTRGDTLDVTALPEKLVDMGYRRTSLVEDRGQFSLRGGILDVFSPGEDWPVRVEFFGDEIESMRLFDPANQRSRDGIPGAVVIPAAEFFPVPSLLQEGEERLLAEALKTAAAFRREGNSSGAEKVLERARHFLQRLKEEGPFPGAENYFAYFYGKGASLLDYLPPGGCLFLDEPLRLQETYQEAWQQLKNTEASLLLQGDLLPTQTEYYFTLEELLDSYPGPVTAFSLFARQVRHTSRILSLEARTLPPYQGDLKLLGKEIQDWSRENQRVLLTCRPQEARSLKGYLEEQGISLDLLQDLKDSRSLPPGKPVLVPASCANGFVLPREKLVVVTEREILKRRARVRPRPKRKEALRLADYRELKIGDYVVHEQHGIGSYQGIRTLNIGGIHRDYLYIKYTGTDKLFIPTDQIDNIRKYIGVEGKSPRLSSLGGQDWNRVKAKVRESVEELARELLGLYSEREAAQGFSFSPDQAWQQEFEDRFPYRETPDQLKAVEDVKKDMEATRPMDRLICGDVGFGKTEVALRGAFKAILDGKQAAFLVPTTILAQQHFRTFQERFEGYPVSVDVLSRFRSPKEQRETLKKLRTGRVDLVIGTHRLLSGDVRFKDLGILIVDEEQRFGVKHKEKLKMFKKNVDVLTLTATPIPRTLHMSLAGARDLSIIETPPEDRYPIQTYVAEYSDYLFREAVLREVNRGGQVYFVYNRVQNIEKWLEHLQKLLPDIRIGLGHGQMSESRLERVMFDFLNKKYDLLVSTTIVEAGLDLPNVNTMIIYDADKLGLAQLYQLRGRVGRSNRVAYCYLTYQKEKVLTEVAEKRLQAIREFTELGSGLKIALRDLEIRGAGNILGPEQHGFMAAVGFDLYCQLLESSVRVLKGEKPAPKTPEIRVELSVNAYIPAAYVPDQEQKIDLYQKIAQTEDNQDLQELRAEMRDRYGPLPPPVENLLQVARIKQLALLVGLESLHEEGGLVRLAFPGDRRFDSDRIWKLARASDGRVRVSFGKGIVFKVARQGWEEGDFLVFLLEFLGALKDLAH
jgi:transcription-repair coupling factor (superfamily II helicase)